MQRKDISRKLEGKNKANKGMKGEILIFKIVTDHNKKEKNNYTIEKKSHKYSDKVSMSETVKEVDEETITK